jgi:hypothetical protein
MKYLFIVILALTVGCGAPTSVQTPAGKAAYTADQLIVSLGIFQDAAIGANSQKILSDPSTRLIVTFVKSAVTTVQAAPLGWKATVTTGLDSLASSLPPSDAQKYSSYIGLLRTMIASL